MHPIRRARPLALLLPPLVALWACEPFESDEQDGEEGSLVTEVSGDECVSGQRWVGGEEESDLMHPGGDCISCHQREDEGPSYLVAGTIYELMGEPDECFGVDGATVEITDAAGRSWSLPTNDAGNFYLASSDGPLTAPYRAAVVMDGMRLEMATAQSSGNCASCHTAQGTQGAPGRVVVP